MVEIIEPADAETAAIQYLAEKLGADAGFGSVAVVGSMPGSSPGYVPPVEAVVVRLTGAVPRGLAVDLFTLTLTSWAGTPDAELRASDIGRRAGAHMRAAERLGFMGGVPCTEVQGYSFYKDPDPITGRARYSGSYGVALRGRVVGV